MASLMNIGRPAPRTVADGMPGPDGAMPMPRPQPRGATFGGFAGGGYGGGWQPRPGFGLNAQGQAPGQTMQRAGGAAGGGQLGQWQGMLQSDPTGQLAFEALNKDPAFFMGNRDAITQAVGGDLGAWRNARDSASSNRRQLTPEELTQIASFGSPGATPGVAMPGTGGLDPGMNYAGGSSGFNEAAQPIGGGMNYTGGSGSFNESNLAGGVQPIGQESRTSLGAIGNMGLDINRFLDPAMGFRIGEATKAVENSAAARGGLLSGSTLRGVSDRANQVAGEEYGKAVDRAFGDRSFNYGVDSADRDFAYRSQTGDRDFNYARDKDNRDTQIGLNRDDRNFNFDRERYNTDFAYRAAVDERNHQYDVDKYNQQTDINLNRDDRNFNNTRLMDLARLGLTGTQGSNQLLQTLATLLNSNIMAGGGAGAAGQIGGANSINAMITQLLQQMQGNQLINGLRP